MRNLRLVKQARASRALKYDQLVNRRPNTKSTRTIRERNWCEEEFERQEATERACKEEEKFKKLEATVAAWKRAQDIRAFITGVKQSVNSANRVIEPGSEMDKYLKWAED